MANIAVFASGNGSNFEALARFFFSDDINNIKVLICNNKNAYVVDRADRLRVPCEYVSYKNEEKEAVEKKIIEILEKNEIEVVFLAGFMKILTPFFIKNVSVPVINIHPSILPKYKGVAAIERAFESDDAEIGISIHYVVEEVDGGEIIFQKSIPLRREKGLEQVEEDVHQLEHKWYPVIAEKVCAEINDKKN